MRIVFVLSVLALPLIATASTKPEDLYNSAVSILNSFPSSFSPSAATSVPSSLESALTLLKAAHDLSYLPATLLLGDVHYSGKYSIPRNTSLALSYYVGYTELVSDPEILARIGVMYATGMGTPTLMAHALIMGTYHLSGISVKKSCEIASNFLSNVAHSIIKEYLSVEVGGKLPLHPPKKRLEDTRDQKSLSGEDVLTYYEYTAGRGDISAMLVLGQVYYSGSNAAARDLKRAFSYFQKAFKTASLLLKEQEKSETLKKQIGEAAGYLGVMKWRGDGTLADIKTAKKFLDIGVEYENPHALTYSGIMYQRGIEVKQDIQKAIDLWNRAGRDAYAQTLLGDYYISTNSYETAHGLFNAATPTSLYAMFRNAELFLEKKQCTSAASLLKSIGERGWDDTMIRAQEAAKDGDYEQALILFAGEAEANDLDAQLNFIYIFEKMNDAQRKSLEGRIFFGLEKTVLKFMMRAAAQGHSESKIKVGDYFYTHVPNKSQKKIENNEEPKSFSIIDHFSFLNYFSLSPRTVNGDLESAAEYYRDAAEQNYSPVAMYNLGYMYEYGLGVEQDPFMSKRWYEQSLSAGPEGYIPCKIGLARIWIKHFNQLIIPLKSSKIENGEKDSIEAKEKEILWEEEEEEYAVLNELLGAVWGDLIMLGLLGFAALYLWRQRFGRELPRPQGNIQRQAQPHVQAQGPALPHRPAVM